MGLFERVHELVERVAGGANGKLLDELIRLCKPYLLRVQKEYGFGFVSHQQMCESIIPSAIGLAVSKWPDSRSFFYTDLKNACRDELRQEAKSLRRRSHETLLDEIAEAADNVSPWRSMADRLAHAEKTNLVRCALREEDRVCQRILLLRARGSTYAEIGCRLALEYNKVRTTRITNINHMKRWMRDQHPDLFGD